MHKNNSRNGDSKNDTNKLADNSKHTICESNGKKNKYCFIYIRLRVMCAAADLVVVVIIVVGIVSEFVSFIAVSVSERCKMLRRIIQNIHKISQEKEQTDNVETTHV